MTSYSERVAAVVGPPADAPESGVARHDTRARRAAAAAVPACYLLAAVLLTQHLWADPASRLVTGNPHDTDQFAWFMRYAATAVRHGRLPALVTTALNAPTGVNIMWNTSMLLPGVVLAPVTWLAGPQVSLTILTTAGFAGSATALFWVLRRWEVSTPAAALAGAVYGFSPALLQSALGHYDLELVILPPLIIDAGLRLTVGRPARPAGPRTSWPARWLARVPAWIPAGAWLGLLIAGQLFINEELALTTALAGVLVVLVLAVSRPLAAARRVLPTVAGLLVAALVALALAGHALQTQFRGRLAEHGSAYLPNSFANDLANFVTPQRALFFHTAASAAAAARYQAGPTEYLAYLGWPLIAALVVAAAATWHRPAGRAATVALVVLCLFSLGGHLRVAGTSHPALELPWQWLEKIPLLGVALPDRLSILADGFAAVLLAIGIDEARARLAERLEFWCRPTRWWQTAAVLAVAVACCLPLLPRPLRESRTAPLPAGWSAMFSRLALSPGGSVLVLPFPRTGMTLAMRWSASSGEPSSMIGGYFLGPGAGGNAHLGGVMPNRKADYLNFLWAEGVPAASPYASEAAIALHEWVESPGGPGKPPKLNDWPVMHAGAALAQLAAWRPQAVVADATVSSPLGEFLAKVLGPPTVTVDDLIGWRLAPGVLRALLDGPVCPHPGCRGRRP